MVGRFHSFLRWLYNILFRVHVKLWGCSSFKNMAVKTSKDTRIQPWKITCWTQKWRFGSNDVPVQTGDFQAPAVTPLSSLTWLDGKSPCSIKKYIDSFMVEKIQRASHVILAFRGRFHGKKQKSDPRVAMSFSSPRLPPSLVCRDRHTKPSNKVGNKEGALTQILIRSSPCCWLGCFFPTTDPWDECVFTYIWLIVVVNAGKYAIHGSYMILWYLFF